MERLEAEDEADWWRRAASAAASMSTSLRERGTFSAFRERFSSSRPFRLSERPRRISERELGEKAETFAPSVPVILSRVPQWCRLSPLPTPPQGPKHLDSPEYQNSPDADNSLTNDPCWSAEPSLSPACSLPYDRAQEGKPGTNTIRLVVS